LSKAVAVDFIYYATAFLIIGGAKMINEITTEREWHNLYPEVDQEYVWEYPLFRGISDSHDKLFSEENKPLSNELSIYIHVPFCLYRCPMCGFYTETVKDRSFSKQYTDALLKEFLSYEKAFDFKLRKLKSIYFGGGTASLLEPCDVERLISYIKNIIPNNCDVEITMENHPNIATYEYLKELKALGVNRVSFGIQSFDDEELSTLQLLQRSKRNKEVLFEALNLEFDTVAADLIYRMPKQTTAKFLNNLQILIDLNISTISLYSMGLSERQEDLYDLLPSQETDREMFYASLDLLTSSNYIQIAQPDFCLPGHINQDCILTWKAPQGEQISLGAGAWSYFNGFLICNTHNSKKYINDVVEHGYSIQQLQKATIDDQMSRYMVLGARCFTIPNKPFEEYFGISMFDVYGQEIRLLKNQGLVVVEGDSLVVTREGKYFVDNISKTFYSPANRCRLQPYCYGIGEEWR